VPGRRPPQGRPVPPGQRAPQAGEKTDRIPREDLAKPAAPRTAKAELPAAPAATERVRPRRPVPPPRDNSRTARRTAKVLFALVSVLVFSLSAFAWATIAKFNSSLTTADVIGAAGGGEKPADGAVDILLVGMDSRTDAQGHKLPANLLNKLHAGADNGEINTDTLILVHIPNDGRAATAMSIPRDSYVDIPGYGKHKINSAFGYAKNDAMNKLRAQGVKDPAQLDVQSNQAGAKETIATVEKLTSTTIDHYAEVNLVGFYDISNAIGGVPVCLKQAVNDRQYSGAVFKKGEQEVEGANALAFVRQRHNIPGGSTDLQRNRRQQAFLAGMAKKVLSAGTLTSPGALNSLIDSVKKAVVIDKGWDITGFAQQMQGLTGGKLKFATIPIQSLDLQTPNDGSAVEINPQQVAEFIKGSREKPKPKPSQAATATNKATTVDVHNATSITGMASTVLKTLTSKGFTGGQTSNASQLDSTVIRYPEGAKAGAQQVAAGLGGNYTLELDSSLPAGHVAVYLGANYSGPGSSGGSSPSSDSSQSDGSGSSSAGGDSGSGSAASPKTNSPSKAPQPPMPPITADGISCVD
jgi:LCP family protein required for cell wall assembly